MTSACSQAGICVSAYAGIFQSGQALRVAMRIIQSPSLRQARYCARSGLVSRAPSSRVARRGPEAVAAACLYAGGGVRRLKSRGSGEPAARHKGLPLAASCVPVPTGNGEAEKVRQRWIVWSVHRGGRTKQAVTHSRAGRRRKPSLRGDDPTFALFVFRADGREGIGNPRRPGRLSLARRHQGPASNEARERGRMLRRCPSGFLKGTGRWRNAPKRRKP